MKCRGKIKDLTYSIEGDMILSLRISDYQLDAIRKLEDMELSVDIDKYRERRGLDANAYFHVLVGKIAEVVGQSKHYIKNDLIGKYGQPEIIDEKFSYITTQIEPDKMHEQEYLHAVTVDIRKRSDKTFYTYMIMRGSHTYNTKEMSTLIDGAVQEAKDLGIETATPEQIERMEREWKVKLVNTHA